MKSNSVSRNNSHHKEKIILGTLKTKTINKIAHMCGFIKRKGGKISPSSLIIGFLHMVSKKRNTYSDWAIQIGLLEGKTITKQSMHERMNESTENVIKKVVEQQLSEKLKPIKSKKLKGLLSKFRNVYVDDSTTLHLPDALVESFPGNISKGERRALAKIHALYNLSQNNFSFLHVHSFSNNDQSLAPNILANVQKGDLCLRDLGFFVLDVLDKLITKGVYCVTRKNYQSKIYDVKTGTEIDLMKELKKKKIFDKEVLIGKKQQLKIRLVAFPIPHAQANERRRKARNDRDKRLNHSKQYYKSLGYSIYLTNITRQMCGVDDIAQLYKLRWNIEIIFKSWKSCFSLDKIIHHQCTNTVRVKYMIYLMRLYTYLFHISWRQYLERESQNGQVKLSLLKMASFFNKHFSELINEDKYLFKQIKVHCAYEKRKDRLNAREIFDKLAA
jgi:Transposase DDE domain